MGDVWKENKTFCSLIFPKFSDNRCREKFSTFLFFFVKLFHEKDFSKTKIQCMMEYITQKLVMKIV